MLVVETIAKIRRAHFVQGKPIKQICRELKLSRMISDNHPVRRRQPCWPLSPAGGRA
jgi:hypothetical protein